jgi:hypothetical protein
VVLTGYSTQGKTCVLYPVQTTGCVTLRVAFE